MFEQSASVPDPPGRNSTRLLLEALVRQESPSTTLPDPPARALGLLDGSLQVLDLTIDEWCKTVRSWLGPAVFHQLVEHIDHPPTLWGSVLLLPTVPLELPGVLRKLHSHRDIADPVSVGAVFARLEFLLGALDEPLSPLLVSSLGLPWALGYILDGLVYAIEAGAEWPDHASALMPLLLSLDRLGVDRVWDLFPATRSSLSHRAADIPLDVLTSTAEALILLEASGVAVRILALVLLLSEPPRIKDAHRRTLTRLLTSTSVQVPKDRVVHLWSLANR